MHFIKKDREIENKIKKYLLKDNLNPADIVKDIRKIVFEKHPILSDLKVQEKIYLNPEKINQEYVEVFDLKEWIDIRGFKTEIYKDNLEVEVYSTNIEKIKTACHSYAEALARIEHSMLVREKLIKQLKIDIRPRYVLYFLREKKTAGWSELRKQI